MSMAARPGCATRACLRVLSPARSILQLTGNPTLPNSRPATPSRIARNHPFIDGNKRTAYVALETFLALNGFTFPASDEASVLTMLSMAAGDLPDTEFTAWVRRHAVPQG